MTCSMPNPTRKSLETKDPRKSLFYFLPAIGWALVIIYFSVKPGDKLPSLMKSMNDKLIHGGIYFLSAGLIYLGFIRYNFNNVISRGAIVVTITACIVFGAAIEIVQHYLVAKRAGDWMDFLANTAGSIVCVLLFAIFHKGKSLARS